MSSDSPGRCQSPVRRVLARLGLFLYGRHRLSFPPDINSYVRIPIERVPGLAERLLGVQDVSRAVGVNRPPVADEQPVTIEGSAGAGTTDQDELPAAS